MRKKLKKLLKIFGPGIITGASDDDPSGIATYSIAGASAGYSLLWTSFLTFPLMAAVQEMCARIGLVTQKGLAGTIKTHYKSKVLLYFLALLIIISNTINIGADLSGMVAATKLLLPVPELVSAIFYTVIIIALMVYFPYKFIASRLKWLTFALFAYLASAVVANLDWTKVFYGTLIPNVEFNKQTISLVVALLGTTISPYLFFWQTSEEVEEVREKEKKDHRKIIVTKHELKMVREDVNAGMFFSNIVMFAIIATAASTLFANGITNIETADQAARALEPIAGKAASLLFTLGIVGTGMLAIPVLAGAAAYAIAEIFNWDEGLSKSFRQAKAFYAVIIFSTFIGFLMTFLGISPFKALFYTAVIYGLIAPVLIFVILLVCNNKKIMGQYTNTWITNTLGIITFLIMSLAAIAFLLTLNT